jgi:hypothetical protein
LEILSTARVNVSSLLINMIGFSDSEYHYGYYDHYYLNPLGSEEPESKPEITDFGSSK